MTEEETLKDPWEEVERLQKQFKIDTDNLFKTVRETIEEEMEATKRNIATKTGILIITSDTDISIIKQE